MEAFFVSAYPLAGIGLIAAYFPQIKTLIYANASPDGVSIVSWFVWLVCNILTLGYGVFHLKDNMMVLTTASCTLLIGTVIGLILYNRHVRFAVRKTLDQMGFEKPEQDESTSV